MAKNPPVAVLQMPWKAPLLSISQKLNRRYAISLSFEKKIETCKSFPHIERDLLSFPAISLGKSMFGKF